MQNWRKYGEICDAYQVHDDPYCHFRAFLSGPTFCSPIKTTHTQYRSSWGDVDLTVAVEVVARKFETAVALFANAVLDDTHGCQGSNCLLLLHVVIDSSFRCVLWQASMKQVSLLFINFVFS